MSRVDARDCRTRLENAHRTVIRELLYSWHPWFGMRVVIHETIAKSDGVAFRCTLSGSGSDRLLEIPAWMFEPAAHPEQARVVISPRVEMAALSTLAELLRQALKNGPAPSHRLLEGALRSSHDENRGEDHGDQSISASVVRIGSSSKAMRRQRSSSADRPVWRRVADISNADSVLAGAVRGDARHADQLDDASDLEPRPGKRGRGRNGGRP
jgi:hypothetical protein